MKGAVRSTLRVKQRQREREPRKGLFITPAATAVGREE